MHLIWNKVLERFVKVTIKEGLLMILLSEYLHNARLRVRQRYSA